MVAFLWSSITDEICLSDIHEMLLISHKMRCSVDYFDVMNILCSSGEANFDLSAVICIF